MRAWEEVLLFRQLIRGISKNRSVRQSTAALGSYTEQLLARRNEVYIIIRKRRRKRGISVLVVADLYTVYFATLTLSLRKDTHSVVLETSQNACIFRSKKIQQRKKGNI